MILDYIKFKKFPLTSEMPVFLIHGNPRNISNEIEHDIFIRNDLDVYLQCDIQYQQAVLGTVIDIPTLDGDVKLKIPSGLTDGQILRLKGKGFKQPNSHRVGNQYVKIMINIPKKISRKTHKLLADISKEIGDQVIFRRFSG